MVTNKVFNLSFCKTGTTSLEFLVGKNGKLTKFPYMEIFYKNINLCRNMMLDKNYKCLDKFIAKYDFFSDLPFNFNDYYTYLNVWYNNFFF